MHRYGSVGAIDPRVRPFGYDKGGYLMPGMSTVWNGTGHPEYVSPPGAGQGGRGEFLPVTLQVDGKVLHQSLLMLKRKTGTPSIGARLSMGLALTPAKGVKARRHQT